MFKKNNKQTPLIKLITSQSTYITAQLVNTVQFKTTTPLVSNTRFRFSAADKQTFIVSVICVKNEFCNFVQSKRKYLTYPSNFQYLLAFANDNQTNAVVSEAARDAYS